MGRPQRHDVDYFPFFVKDGKTLHVLESKYKCKGTGFFTNVFRFLAQRPDHYFCMEDPGDQLWFFSRTLVDEEEGLDMINMMVKTEKLDKYLWEQKRVIASQDFLESLKGAYEKRSNECITLDEIKSRYKITSPENTQGDEFLPPETHKKQDNFPQSGGINPQTKVKKSKEESPPNGGHFSKSAGEYLIVIEENGKLIEKTFPKIWQTVQQWANQKIHPGAIAEVLTGIVPYIEKADNPQAYVRSIMKSKAQNWQEKGFIQEHEKMKVEFADLVKKLQKL